MFRKKLRTLLLIVCAFCISLTGYLFNYRNTCDYASAQNVVSQENMTSYLAEDGKTHNIYWAKGVKAPKMTEDPMLNGQEGYFKKTIIDDKNGKSVTYEAPYVSGNGYYDLNKNRELRPNEYPLCYLGSAGNLLYWWMEQNREYIDTYVSRLKNTDIYGQEDGLKQLIPFDEKMWSNILTPPVIEYMESYNKKFQSLGRTKFITENLSPYYTKQNTGYYPDLVIDFFINGYKAIEPYDEHVLHTPETFIKDKLGGYFYPIFGKNVITERYFGHEKLSYKFLSENFRRFFAEGKGVSLSFLLGKKAHAITVWGAEYDDNNNLCRLFTTDTDDFYEANLEDEFLVGMRALNTLVDINGSLMLSNNLGENVKGNYLQEISTISLAQDIWHKKLDDTNPPEDPIVEITTKSGKYPINKKMNINVNATTKDTGFLSYQWYESADILSEGSKIDGANKPVLEIGNDNYGVKYYYCIVTNNKNGKKAMVKTNPVMIEVSDNPTFVDAQIPVVKFNAYGVTYSRYQVPDKIFVDASVSDGGTLSYQWYYNYGPSDNLNGTKIEGETKPYIYPQTKDFNKIFYFCEITNTNTSPEITGEQVVTVKTKHAKYVKINDRILITANNPLIINKIHGATYNKGDKAENLFIDAKIFDGGKLSYQWYIVNDDYSEVPIKNQTSSSFTPDTSKPGITMYKCVVTNTNDLASEEKIAVTHSEIISVEVKGEVDLSSDNHLVSLNVKNATISPLFNKDILFYSSSVHVNIEKLDISFEACDKASVEVNNSELKPGENDVTIKVTAENGDVRIYTINVKRGLNHNYGEWKVVKNPTCTEKGLERRYCNECDSYEERVINELTHDFGEWQIVKEPTCKDVGKEQRVCKNCGAIEEREISVLNEHKFDDWIVVKEATTTEKGQEKRTCSICGKTEYRDIPVIDHQDSSDESSQQDSESIIPPVEGSDNNQSGGCGCGGHIMPLSKGGWLSLMTLSAITLLLSIYIKNKTR